MSESFKDRLKAAVENLAPQFQEIGEQDMHTLLQAGATSFERARALCADCHVPAKVRSLACWALGRMGDKDAIPSILRALEDDHEPSVRAGSAHALGELDDPVAVEPLIRALTMDPSADVRRMAAWSLGRIGDDSALNPLIAVLNNPKDDPSLRAECAEALGELGLEAAVMPLLEALCDTSAEVRFFAAFALGLIGDPAALPALQHMAATDGGIAQGWGPVREEAADAIKAINVRSRRGASRDA
jgi:HEAT repeat protein